MCGCVTCEPRWGPRPFSFLLDPNYNPTHMAMLMTAGGLSGLLETILLYPLDTVVTRLQFQNHKITPKRHYYKGMFDCIKRMVVRENFSSLYQGLGPPVISEVPKGAINFLVFDTLLAYFFARPFHSQNNVVYGLSGAGAGMTQCIFTSPFEVIKLNMQLREAIDYGDDAWNVASKIRQRYGIFGFYRGISSHLLRTGLFNFVYLTSFSYIKAMFPPPRFHTTWYTYRRKLLLGGCCGVVAGICNCPFDVIKIRIQAPCENPPKYNNTIQTVSTILEEEGVKPLFRGLTAKSTRMAIGGGVLMVAYDNMMDFMESFYPPPYAW